MTIPARRALCGLVALILAPPVRGDITYSLNFNPASSTQAQQVANSVAAVAAFYNQHGSFNKHWSVTYHPGIPTAEGSYNGYMGYGGMRNERVVFHEAAHTFGMGTTGAYANLISGGVWKGFYGNRAQFETYNTYGDGLHGDGHAIWPGGFNYDSEDGFIQRIWHTRVMAGIRADMGIMAFTREARNAVAHLGGGAEFRVEAPLATGYQWQRNGVNLTDGPRISGARGPVLRIADAAAADAGAYRCSATGAGETLLSRPRQLWIQPQEALGHWTMNGNVLDSAKSHHATAFGSPGYVAGKIGQAINLDGTDDYVRLPDAAVLANDFTVATWVFWNGGGSWQRVFDFGTGTHQHIYLTPRSGPGPMRLGFRDNINGINGDFQVNAPTLPTGQWVHLAAVLKGGQATLYMNGRPVGVTFGIPVRLSHFPPTQNYIGRSQYADPYFNGRIDDFRIYNHALGAAEIWNLWGESPNRPPVFESDTIVLADAPIGTPLTGRTLAGLATDPDGDPLAFTKLSGPAWLSIAANGALSGTPTGASPGMNTFVVRVSDSAGATSEATVRFLVKGTVAHWDFEGGTANTHVPYAPASAGQYSGSIVDRSGGTNHLSPWNTGWTWYRPLVPAAATPRTGAANTLSIQHANNWPSVSAIGTSLTTWSPREWTIEAAIRPDNATSGSFQTFIGRDSRGAHAGDPALAALYFAITPQGGLRILFTDVAGNAWNITSPSSTLQSAKWYAVAATSNGSVLSLYLKKITDGDAGYTLLGTRDISSSTDPAMSTGTGDGGNWDAGVITIARGLYNGSHTDRFFGHMDDVRLTEGVLAPADFLHSLPPDPTLTPAEEWRLAHFETAENTGDAADGEDPDRDGIPNLFERAFGGNPKASDPSILPATDPSAPLLSILYRKSVAATDLVYTVEQSTDLTGPWTPATGESVVVSNADGVETIRFTSPAGDAGRKFLRVKVTAP